jgi:hypothetical protein
MMTLHDQMVGCVQCDLTTLVGRLTALDEARIQDDQAFLVMRDRLVQAERRVAEAEQQAVTEHERSEAAVALFGASAILTTAILFLSTFGFWFI